VDLVLGQIVTENSKSTRIDEIICLLVTEALEIEQKTILDFVGALNNVQMSVSSRVTKIMESSRAAERLHTNITQKEKHEK